MAQHTTFTLIGVKKMTDEENWASHYPDEKIPGVAEPLEGKCGAKLRDKKIKELGIVRYCNKTAGMGTEHLGEGTCKWHFGNAPNHVRGAMQVKMQKELVTLAEKLGEPEPLGPPEVEAFVLASKMKTWTLILENKMNELNGILEVTDKAGVEHVRALIEVMERAWERYQGALEFMMKYDLRKRVIELEEHQANLVGSAFLAIILSRDLKLSETQIELARNLFAEKMTEMGAEMEPSWASGIIDADVVD
jgi:hypothetical protein